MIRALVPALAAVSILLTAQPAMSETQTENIVAEQRISVSTRIDAAAAKAFMPAGWEAVTTDGKAALTVIFMDRTLQLTPDGKPLGQGVNRLLVLAMAGRNAAGETRSLIVGGYSADPSYVPGAYGTNRAGDFTLERTEKKAGLAVEVIEHWTIKGADGGMVSFDIDYDRGTPTLRPFEQKNYSGKTPDFYRIYRGQQATETLRDGAIDHVHAVSLKASGGLLGAAINGTEQIASITAAPIYTRLTFLP